MPSRNLALVILLALTAWVQAAPVSQVIPEPSDMPGSGLLKKTSGSYHAIYDSEFGGHWDVSGIERGFGFGGYSSKFIHDSFSGTVSDITINGTFTNADFSWSGDWIRILEFLSYERIYALNFTLVISNGIVTGSATYLAE